MENKVIVKPGWLDALALWVGSDHYSLSSALRRDEFHFSPDAILAAYEVESVSIRGFDKRTRYCFHYHSESRHCFISLDHLPEKLQQQNLQKVTVSGYYVLYMERFWKEPSVLFLPLLVPVFMAILMSLFGVWDQFVLHNQDLLQFFARPGCDEICVRKVLSIHSLVGLLFAVQLGLLVLPMIFLWFQAPRYKSALNYRVLQAYSTALAVIGVFVFAQLVVFFPFKQYTRFVELGFDPKVERAFSTLKATKK